MGLDAKAKLVAGVRFGSVFQRKIEIRSATRYDSITGLPFTIQEKVQVFFIKGVKCNHNNFPEKIYEIDELQLPEFKGLELFYDDYKNKEEDAILGILLKSTQSHRLSSDLIEEISLDEINNGIRQVDEILGIDALKYILYCI